MPYTRAHHARNRAANIPGSLGPTPRRVYMENMYSFLQNFGKEILADEKKELEEKQIRAVLELASGAAYGTGRHM